MTFSRIKPNGWAVNEKLTSSQMTSLDIDHAHALDKTGDNVAGGGGISGRIDLLASGSLYIDGYVLVSNGATLGPTLEIGYGGLFQCDATSLVSFYGETDWKGGSILNMDSGSKIELDGGATFQLVSGSVFQGNIVYPYNQAAPTITQAGGSTTGINIGIVAQNVSGSNVAGSVVLSPGSGVSGVSGHDIYPMVNMCPTSVGNNTTTGVLQVLQVSLAGGLTANTQKLKNQVTMAYASTTTSAGSIFYILDMLDSTSAFVEIAWMRRINTGGATGAFGNKGAFCITCNSAGTTVGEANPTVAYSGYDDNTAISATYNTNQVVFSCANGSTNNLDWQFMITIIYI